MLRLFISVYSSKHVIHCIAKYKSQWRSLSQKNTHKQNQNCIKHQQLRKQNNFIKPYILILL